VAVDVTMSRVLLPRTGKTVASDDWTTYQGDLLPDHVICGYTISVGCGTRAIDVAAGNARVIGLHLANTAACTDAIACLAVCMTHSIYLLVGRDCMCDPNAFTFTSNTTGTTPCCGFKIGTATTDCTATTASVTTIGTAKHTAIAQGCSFPIEYAPCSLFWRIDSELLFQNTGTEAAPVWCIATGRCVGKNLLGSGKCGDRTVTTCACCACCTCFNYVDLTINACQTLTVGSGSYIRVIGTLTLNGTITTSQNPCCSPGGSGGGCGGGDGGAGGKAKGNIFIFTNSIAGTGTVCVAGCLGGAGGNGTPGFPSCCDHDGNPGTSGIDASTLASFKSVGCDADFDDVGSGCCDFAGGIAGGGNGITCIPVSDPAGPAPTDSFNGCRMSTRILQRLSYGVKSFSGPGGGDAVAAGGGEGGARLGASSGTGGPGGGGTSSFGPDIIACLRYRFNDIISSNILLLTGFGNKSCMTIYVGSLCISAFTYFLELTMI